MSYEIFRVYGYGLKIGASSALNPEKVDRLLAITPKVKAAWDKFVDENFIVTSGEHFDEEEFEDSITSFLEQETGCIAPNAVSGLVRTVVSEAYDIPVTAFIDFDDMSYALYEPSYPWNRTCAGEENLTEHKLELVFDLCARVIHDADDYEIGYFSPENGC